MPSSSRRSAACRIVAQSDWLPITIATSGRPGIRKVRVLRSERRPACHNSARRSTSFRFEQAALGDDVRQKLVFKQGNSVFQHQLTLLQPLKLKVVGMRLALQGFYRAVEVA